eukprot:2372257-Alexandrium_andersonii.AAC.1
MQTCAKEADTRRLRRSVLKPRGLRPSPIPSRGEGHLAHWACWDRVPLGLGLGQISDFDPRVRRARGCSAL